MSSAEGTAGRGVGFMAVLDFMIGVQNRPDGIAGNAQKTLDFGDFCG
jgi:hypothetical protein